MAPEEEVILTVTVGTTQHDNGTFSPAVTVIRQQARKWTTMLLQLTDTREFPDRDQAVVFGRSTALKELQRRHPLAQIKLS